MTEFASMAKFGTPVLATIARKIPALKCTSLSTEIELLEMMKFAN